MARLAEWSFREGNKRSGAKESGSILRNVIFKYIFNSNYASLVFFQGSGRTVFLRRNINHPVETMDLLPIKMHIWISLEALQGVWKPEAQGSQVTKLCTNNLCSFVGDTYL